MPSISDLPTEILHQIISLSAETATSNRERRRLLRSTSLVGREWRAPSQTLLLLRVDLSKPRTFSSFSTYVEGLSTPPTLTSLAVDHGKQIQLVLGASVGLRSLRLVDRGTGTSIPASAVHEALTAGITTLVIAARITGILSADSPTYDLEHVELFHNRLPPSRVLGQLLQSSPKLTRLTLHWPWYGTPLPDSLLYIAPRLTHLSIDILPPLLEGRSGHPFLLDFLPACTSIISLTVHHRDPSTFVELVRLIKHPLETLDTSSLWLCSQKQDRSRVELVEAMSLPAMKELKRWRIPWKEVGVGLGGQAWLAICEQRGVKLRSPLRQSVSL